MTGISPHAIAPKIDAYGKAGRTGALADLVEFRAIKGTSMTAADLADLVTDNGWTSKPLRQIVLAEDEEDDTPESLADQAFILILQRIEVLEDRYPFELTAGRLVVKDGFNLKASPYIALLAISIAHAWQVPCSTAPENALEFLVSAALNRSQTGRRPWSVATGMGTAERAGRTFAEALAESASALGLSADPRPTPISVSARDAGVDTLVGLVWKDNRPGNWVFIGQATCGMTETWSSKLTQPGRGHWRGYLQELLTPHRFLAVPHHVDDRFMVMVHKADDGIVLDRLRLTLSLDGVLAEVTPVVDAVLSSAA